MSCLTDLGGKLCSSAACNGRGTSSPTSNDLAGTGGPRPGGKFGGSLRLLTSMSVSEMVWSGLGDGESGNTLLRFTLASRSISADDV